MERRARQADDFDTAQWQTQAPDGSRKMRRSLIVALTSTALSMGAMANDGVELRTKAIASAGAVKMMDAPRVDGPFTTGRDPLTALIQIEAREHLTAPQATCEAALRLRYNA